MKKMFAIGMAVVILMGMIYFGIEYRKLKDFKEAFEPIAELIDEEQSHWALINNMDENNKPNYEIVSVEIDDMHEILVYSYRYDDEEFIRWNSVDLVKHS